VRYGSIGGLEYEVDQSRLYCLCINVALCSTALQCICRVIRRSSMTMKAHTYYIIFGRPPIGRKLPPFPPGGATAPSCVSCILPYIRVVVVVGELVWRGEAAVVGTQRRAGAAVQRRHHARRALTTLHRVLTQAIEQASPTLLLARRGHSTTLPIHTAPHSPSCCCCTLPACSVLIFSWLVGWSRV